MEHNKKTSLIALLGIFTALAFILGFIESLIPPFTGIPGVKAGFANIVSMTVLYLTGRRSDDNTFHPTFYSFLCALVISTVRILLGGITYNGMSASFYGLAGAFLSLTVMFLLGRTRSFSITAVSIAGGVTHNIAQLILAVIMLGRAVFYYLPMLIVSGLAAGLAIGIVSAVLIRRLSVLSIFR